MKTQLKSQLNKKLVTPSRPVILNLNKTSDQNKLEKLFAERKITAISDDYHEQLKELFAVQNPSLVYTPGFGEHLKAYVKKLEAKATLTAHGR